MVRGEGTAMRAVLGASLATLLVASGTAYLIAEVRGQVMEAVRMEETRTQYVAEWKDAEGIGHKVITTREEGEEAGDHAKRHAEDVAALKVEFPPA